MAETPAEKPDAGQTLGAHLREVREQRGLSVHQAAQDLHVDDNIIAALERDEYAELGVPIFVRGHLRNYAQLLGMPADEVIAAYDHAGKRLAAPRLVPMKPEGSPAARRAGLQVFSVIVIVVLVALAVIWWRHRVPAPGATTDGAPQASAAHQPAGAPPAPRTGQVTQPLAVPAPAGASAAASHAAMAVAATGARAPQAGALPKPGTAATAAPGAVVQAQFVVTQASWIEVYDAAGKKLFYNLAPAGDKLTLSGSAPLNVFIGNAPGVSISLNGVPFNFSHFIQANNTAHFNLGAAAKSGEPG